jgi:hypothetical protein
MKYLLIITILTISTFGFAQQNILGLNFKVYTPISDFNKNVNRSTPVGISFNYMRQPVESRLSYGTELGIAMYSSNDYVLPYNGQDVKVNEEDCFWTFHGVLRYELYSTERFITYAEGRLGMTTFFSSTTATEANSDYEGEFDFHGSAFNSGIGGGVLYRIGRVWLNLGANFHSGTKARYRYMPESDQATSFQDGQYQSLTHYVGYRFGVAYRF